MKKTSKILAVLLTVAMLCGVLPTAFALPVAAATNLITNGDFETGDGTGWTLLSTSAVKTEAAKDGNYGLSIPASKSSVVKPVVKANTTYIFSFDFKSASGAKPTIYFKHMDGTTDVDQTTYYPEPDGDNWTHYTMRVDSGDYTQVKFQLSASSKTTATYFDNVTLVEAIPSFDGYILNGDFETGDLTGWSSTRTTPTTGARKDGNYGADLTAGSSSSSLTYVGSDGNGVTVDPNKSYVLSFDNYGVNIDCTVQVKFINANDSSQSKSVYLEGGYNQWAHVLYKFNTADWGGWTQVKIVFYTGYNGGGVTRYFDNVTLVDASPSFDGFITNGGFETGDLTGWSSTRTTATTAAAKDGNYGANLTAGSASSSLNYVGTDGNGITVNPNKDYILSFDNYGVNINCTVQVKFTNANDSSQSKTVYLEGGYNQWAHATYQFNTADWGGWTQVKISFFTGYNGGGVTRYFDNVTLVELNPTFDGYITNGDFEFGELIGNLGAIGTVEVTEEAAKSGEYGAKVTATSASHGLFAWVNVEKNTDYLLTFDHKSDSTAKAAVYIKNENQETLVSDYPDQVAGLWARHRMVFNSGDNTRVAIQIAAGAADTIRYFDNVSLRNLADAENNVTGGLGSVSELAGGKLGVAFKFDLDAAVTYEAPYTFAGGTVIPSAAKDRYTLVKMGALLTNKAANADKLTLEDVDTKSIINIEAEKVIDVTADSVSFAVRVINIPSTAKDVVIYARPYYVYNNGSEDVVVYSAATYNESYNSIDNRIGYTDSSKWELYWNDEFGGDALDETKWTPTVKADGSGDVTFCSTEDNLKVADGNLVITTKEETVGDARYTTGYLNTAYQFSFVYGRLEFRAKLPYGKGVWPALWTMSDYSLYTTLGDGWPRGGEIDILELIGESSTDPAEENNRTATHNLHWGADRDRHLELGSYKLDNYDNHYLIPAVPSEDYHVYAIEWEYRSIKFFVDDVAVSEVKWGNDGRADYLQWTNVNGKTYKVYEMQAANGSTVAVNCDDLDFAFSNPDNKHYLIMVTNLCEGWGDMSNKTDGGNFPQSMYVDYVRVYKPVEN